MKPDISIIIPALNESVKITQMIAHLSTLHDGSKLEVIVVDGSPTGNTIRHITDTKVRTAISPPGRSIQMNQGARAANGEILLFLHADTRLSADAPTEIMTAIHRDKVAGGAFSLSIDSPRVIFRLLESAATIRSRLTKIPYGDQAIFLHHDQFFRLGGFKEIPLMEDVDLMRRLKKTGGRVVILPEKVQTSPRRWKKEGVFYCTARNRMLSTLYLLGVSPDRLVRYYK